MKEAKTTEKELGVDAICLGDPESVAEPLKDKPRQYSGTAKIVAAMLAGLAFGIALHKSGVYRAAELRKQFLFYNYTMLEIFMSASGTSVIIGLLYKKLPVDQSPFENGDKACNRGIGWPATLVGTFMLGAGMTVAGACPGTVFAQIGGGSYRSLITIVSMVLTAALFGAFADHIKKFQNYGISGHEAIDDHPLVKKHKINTVVVRAAIGAMLIVCATIVGLWPGDDKLRDIIEGFSLTYWNPTICGVIIGLCQLPVMIVIGQNLGSAMSYCSLAGALMFFTDKFPYLNKYRKPTMSMWWQPIFLWTAILGAYVSNMVLTEEKFRLPYDGKDITIFEMALGGFLLMFGSRLAGGCTSGHGISGVSNLCWRSFASIGTMFGGLFSQLFFLTLETLLKCCSPITVVALCHIGYL